MQPNEYFIGFRMEVIMNQFLTIRLIELYISVIGLLSMEYIMIQSMKKLHEKIILGLLFFGIWTIILTSIK